MRNIFLIPAVMAIILVLANCGPKLNKPTLTVEGVHNTMVLEPAVVTDTTPNDTDDPAIWINPADPSQSLVIGTDKGDSTGGLFVFDLQGKLVPSKCVHPMKRPNNVDVEYGLDYPGKKIDIAACTERGRQMIRVFSLPDMKAIDNGGISVFEGDSLRDPMGIALYKDPATEIIYAFVGRKEGRDNEYIWQYKLTADSTGVVTGQVVRKFGTYSGKKEIEAIVVDDALGYVYYSDEQVGVRKYSASPDGGNDQLALFATEHVVADHEGIAIYQSSDKTGYLIVSDQGANRFHVFPREGEKGNPHSHPLLKVFHTRAVETDGCEVVSLPLNGIFQHGLFVAMSTDKTFHFYKWEDIAEDDLDVAH
ncbi:MAG: phytase [Breznakibacter sp.]